MKFFWQLDAADVERLRGGDGGRFRDFVVSIIRAQAHFSRIPESAIHTDSRPMKDGGVDCQVDAGQASELSGRLREKTIWQFKGELKSRYGETKLRNELGKPYVIERLRKGYAYRFCIADDLAAKDEADTGQWQTWLEAEARELAGREVDVQVLGSTALAAWASHFPAVVLKSGLRPGSGFQHLEGWGKNARDETPTYVENAAWIGTRDRVATHCDLGKPAPRAVEAVQGVAGVGKTRLVYETVAKTPAAWALVLYTSDESKALEVAVDLMNDPQLRAILVVDECSLRFRLKIEGAVRACRDRIRVIAIDNIGEHLIGLETEALFLRRLSNEVVEEILMANFRTASDPSRRVAVALSQGFLRIAIWICRDGWDGGDSSAKPQLRRLYEDRVSAADRKVIEAISLVTRVGWMEEVAGEWADLCALCQLPADECRDRARALKDSPGFVAIGGRYFYVTPEAIAEVALEQAFRSLIEPDPKSFLERLPVSLEEVFFNRVARCSNKSLRDAVSSHLEKWVASLSSDDLQDKKKADRLVRLAEIQPDVYLPVIRRLIEGSTGELVAAIPGSTNGEWGPRRSLVWLCERAVAFGQFYHDAESILFRLAVNENEPGISNSASGIWKQTVRLYLSGTAIPYLDRLAILRRRLQSPNIAEARLALAGLGEIFEDHFSRTLGPPLFAGAVAPDDWRPASVGEREACFESAFQAIEHALSEPRGQLQTQALDLVLRKLAFLLRHGQLTWARRFLDGRVPVERLPETLFIVDAFGSLGREKSDALRVSAEYALAIRDWRNHLVPDNLHAQLVSEIGRPFYRLDNESLEAEWRARVRRLARQLFTDRKAFTAELPWLTSKEAASGGALGEELAAGDPEAVLLSPILEASIQGTDGLVCGYVRGLLAKHPRHQMTVNRWLDTIEADHPSLAFNIARSAPRQTSLYERALRMFDAGKLTAEALGSLRYHLAAGAFTETKLEELLQRVLGGKEEPEESKIRVGLDLCEAWIREASREARKPKIGSTLLELLRRLLTLRAERDMPHPYEWNRLLQVYAQLRPEEAVQIACL
ncbi:MAG: hypothetical protein L0Z50_36105, partial [Verrucomicrobiales bacterium]|nr:hypothetical protein [Verrucomicrobiales bacterium]